MYYLKILAIAGIIFSPFSLSADHSGSITVLRATVDDAIHPVLQRNIILFQLSSTLHSNCTWLYIEKNNNYFASSLLSAQARNKNVRVWYDEVNHSGVLCKAYTIELAG